MKTREARHVTEKYDVFISFKHHDAYGNVTPEYYIAKQLKEILEKNGLRTFFSEITLQELGAYDYKKVIDSVLDQVNILIVVAASLAHVDSEWVRYEWDGFYNDILSGVKPDGKVFTLLQDISVCDLPRSLRRVQAFDYKNDGLEAVAKVLESIKKQNSSMISNVSDPVGSSYSYADTGEKKRLEIQATLESKKDKQLIPAILEQYNHKALNILDVGCSAGYVTYKVFSEIDGIKNIIGIDKFETCIEDFNREIQDERFQGFSINVESGDFEERLSEVMDKRDIDGFDFIYSALCFHHLNDPKHVLKKLKKFLKDDGYIYIRTCDDGQDIAYPDEENRIDTLIRKTMELNGVSDRYHGRKLFSQLQKSGYKNIRTCNYCIDTIGKTVDERYSLFCNSFQWRKNYYKHQIDGETNLSQAVRQYNWCCKMLDDLEELFYDSGFYYCYNIPIFIAQK